MNNKVYIIPDELLIEQTDTLVGLAKGLFGGAKAKSESQIDINSYKPKTIVTVDGKQYKLGSTVGWYEEESKNPPQSANLVYANKQLLAKIRKAAEDSRKTPTSSTTPAPAAAPSAQPATPPATTPSPTAPASGNKIPPDTVVTVDGIQYKLGGKVGWYQIGQNPLRSSRNIKKNSKLLDKINQAAQQQQKTQSQPSTSAPTQTTTATAPQKQQATPVVAQEEPQATPAETRNLSNSYNTILKNLDTQLNNLKLSNVSNQILAQLKNDIRGLFAKSQTISPQINVVLKEFKATPRTNITIDVSGLAKKYNLNDQAKQQLFNKIKTFIDNTNQLNSTIKFKFVTQPTQTQQPKQAQPKQIQFDQNDIEQTIKDFIEIIGGESGLIIKEFYYNQNTKDETIYQFVALLKDLKQNKLNTNNEKQVENFVKNNFESNDQRNMISYLKQYGGHVNKLQESKDLAPIHIDFTKSKQLNESFLGMFGTAIKMILQRMFGQDVFMPPMTITGNKQQMETFVNALAGEKRYFDSYVQYGLNDPRTYQDRYKLQAAVNDFERNTGIKWPFK